MNPDPKRVEAVFAAALGRTEPETRTAFLKEACGDDEALRARVLKLLDAYNQASGFLEQPASGLADPAVLETPTEALDATPAAIASGAPGERTQAEFSAPAQDDLSFLTPPNKPGSLGRLENYDIEQVLGKGGFGTVFKAFDAMLHRVVAIKVLAPEMAASSAARHRFLREARAAAAVRHEHVVDIHGVWEQPLPYLVMEFVSGQTLLRRVVDAKPRPIREINSEVPQWLCDVVEKLHAKKPEDRYQSAAEVAEVLANYLAEVQLHGSVTIDPAKARAGAPEALAQPQTPGRAQPSANQAPPAAHPGTETERFPAAVRVPFGFLVAGVFVGVLHAVGASSAERAVQGITTLLGFAALYLFGLYAIAAWQSRPRGWHATVLGAAPLGVTAALFGLVLVNIVILTTRTQGLSSFLPIWLKARPEQGPPSPEVKTVLEIAPFDATQADARQHAWAARLGVPVEFVNSAGMTMRLIPAGRNRLGPAGSGESADPFYTATTEVTVAQFRRFVEQMKHQTAGEADKLGGMLVHAGKKTERKAKYVWNNPDFARSDNHPVTLITWHDAMAFCEWLSRNEGRQYRLPTSSEWRWAERAGSDSPFYFGDSKAALEDHGWHVGNSDMHTHAVAAKQPNPWGLFDIYGNVWELSYDWQRDGKAVQPAPGKAGPRGADRIVFLGGGYSASAESSLEPHTGPPLVGYSHLGFRVVCDATAGIEGKPGTERSVDRFVAQWAIEAGGTVAIRANQANERTSVVDGAALPAGAFAVERVDLSKSRRVTETMLGTLTGAKELRELSLRGLPLGDGGLSQLLALGKLEKLDLGGTKITDRALVILSEARGLKSLNLENTPVGDAALKLLEQTKQLERLQGLPLEELNVRKTALTFAGVEALAKLLPKCRIVSDHRDQGK